MKLAFAFIIAVGVFLGSSCSGLEQRFWGYSLKITSPEGGVTFRQDETPSVPIHLKISGWTEERLQATGAYLYLQVDGVTAAEITAYGDQPTATVALTTPGKHVIKAVLPTLEGGELVDEISVTWLKPSPLDKVAGAVTGLVVAGDADPWAGYFLMFLVTELVLAWFGSKAGKAGSEIFMFLGAAAAVVLLSQSPMGAKALGTVAGVIIAYIFLRYVLVHFRLFAWSGDSGLAVGFTGDVAPTAGQIAASRSPQLPAPPQYEVLPPPKKDPLLLRLLRGPTFDP